MRAGQQAAPPGASNLPSCTMRRRPCRGRTTCIHSREMTAAASSALCPRCKARGVAVNTRKASARQQCRHLRVRAATQYIFAQQVYSTSIRVVVRKLSVAAPSSRAGQAAKQNRGRRAQAATEMLAAVLSRHGTHMPGQCPASAWRLVRSSTRSHRSWSHLRGDRIVPRRPAARARHSQTRCTTNRQQQVRASSGAGGNGGRWREEDKINAAAADDA